LDPSPELLVRLERLAAAGIQLIPVPQLPKHFVFERDGFVALVENLNGAFGGIGSPGRLTDKGFAVLIERAGRRFFVAKDHEEEASPAQAALAHRFFTDLKEALR
jgi:hypothetical protein